MNVNIKVLIAIVVGLLLSSHEQTHSEISVKEKKAQKAAENNEPLFLLLKETAEQILSTKDMYDYVIVPKPKIGYVGYDEYYVYAIANNNTISLYKNFWTTLNSLKNELGNLELRNKIPVVEVDPRDKRVYVDNHQFENITIMLGPSPLEHIRSLTDDIYYSDFTLSLFMNIRQACIDNIENSIATMLNADHKNIWVRTTSFSGAGYFYVYSYVDDYVRGQNACSLPGLNYKPSKGDIIYGAFVKSSKFLYKTNSDIEDYIKKSGYNVKIRELSDATLHDPRYYIGF